MSPIKFIRDGSRTFEPLAEAPAIRIARDVGAAESDTMACNIVTFEDCEHEWTVLYDEYIYGLDGTLLLETREGDFEINPGDGIWLPKGTWMIYKAAWASTLIAVYPANWRELEGFE